MCGIAGVAGSAGVTIDRPRLTRMTDALVHRGPDGSGTWLSPDGSTGLGHRRLSILDLSSFGAQPMVSHSGRYTIVFNGEIYNFSELRRRLEALGAAFRGHSDTEVILAGLEHWGVERTLGSLAGMFAMAFWDAQTGTVSLARDRIGIKPLYYGDVGGQLLFASELRPIAGWLGRLPEISVDSLAAYLRLGYVPGPESIFKGIRKLEPGTWLSFRHGVLTAPQPFWSLEQAVRAGAEAPVTDPDDALAGLESVLRTSVGQHMVADVPLGAFLSGGIDSSSVVAMMQSISPRPVRTFSIGFHEAGYDEAGHAAAVARHLGTDHTELYLTDRDARELIPDLPAVYDEPFADASQIPTLLVSRLARASVTVSLSGDGGDELFAGYNRYLFVADFWRRLSRLPLWARRAAAAAVGGVSPGAWDRFFRAVSCLLPRSLDVALPGQKMHKIAAILDARSLGELHWRLVSQWAVPKLALSREAREVVNSSLPTLRYEADGPMEDVLRQMLWDMQTYLVEDILVKVDRASMHYGLEARVPLLDHRLIEYALRVPLALKIRDGEGKWLLRQLLYRYVPQALVDRPKMGFSVPIDHWLRGPLKSWGGDLLAPARLSAHGLLDVDALRCTWDAHISGVVDRSGPLWTALMFQTWWEHACTWV